MASQFPLKKNAVQTIMFPIYDNTGSLVIGAGGLDSEYSIDGGVFNDCTSEAVELTSGGVGSGIYKLALTAAECNGDQIVIQIKTSTANAKTSVLTFYTATQTEDELNTAMAKDSTVAKDATVLKAIATGTLQQVVLLCLRIQVV